MSIKQNFPVIRPTLNLDFAGSQAVDSRIQFTRASAATRTDAQGILKTVRDNKPRVDFDGSTGECRGLLIEEQRSNKVNYSSEFNNSYWQLDSGGTLVPDQAIAPDGSLTADLVRETTLSGISPRLIKTNPWSDLSGVTFTSSVYVKSFGTKRNVFMLCQESSNAFYAHFDIVAGTVVQVNNSGSGVIVGANIKNEGNGWFRISITGSIPSSPIYMMTQTEAVGSTGFGAPTYTGDGSSGVFYWGAQVEVGTFATSYVPSIPTFTSRASSATYFDSTGVLRTAPTNGARYGFGYDSTTQKWISQGLILESAATNLFPTSLMSAFAAVQNMDIVSTSIAAIDGTVGNVFKLTPTATNTGMHSIFRNLASSTPSTRCVSVYLKAAGYNYARIYCDGTDPTTGGVVYDLSTGTTSIHSSYTGANRLAYGMENVGNGWYRCWVSGTATNADWYYHIDVANTAAFGSFAGDGSSGVYAWGPQMEIGSRPTSYIATSGSTVTRAADVSTSAAATRASETAVIKPTEFTKLNSPLAATLYGEGTIISGAALGSGAPALAGLSNSVDRDTHRFLIRRTNMSGDASYAGFNYRLATVINGTSYSIDYSAAQGAQPEWEDAAVHKTIFAIDATSQQGYGDGVAAGITSIAIPNFDKFDQVEIGNGGSSSSWNGHIRKIAYYNKRLSNTQLQALTV